jgi:hypothetical protein
VSVVESVEFNSKIPSNVCVTYVPGFAMGMTPIRGIINPRHLTL